MDELTSKHDRFIRELEDLLNRYSRENESDTPDFVLAQYLVNCLESYELAIYSRKKFFGRDQDK